MKDLNLKFLNSKDNETIPFLPYGVSTIEFAVDGKCKRGYLRPKNSTLLYSSTNKFVGYADDNENFLVVWGAGNEEGQLIKTDSKDRMFLQLIHLRGENSDANITFEHTGLFNTKKLKVFKPNNSPPFKEIIRLATDSADQRLRRKKSYFKGTHMPMYYPRWFPPKEIQYIKPDIHPIIQMEYAEDETGIISPIDIYLESDGQKKKICKVEGDLRYSHLHAEMFALFDDKNIFVLRFWLYWIHKNYRKDLLSASVDFWPEEQIDNLGFIDRISGLEVPDIERFDFIIDAEESKIILYGTDIHYQEYWGNIKDSLVEAKIAGNVDLVTTTARLYPLRNLQNSKYYNPIEAVKEFIVKEKKKKFVPMTIEQKEIDELKSLGINIRAHVPYVERGTIGEKNFLSSDSRQGAYI